ncbi:hypothetical protein [Pasteuria penetrans]|uniref:hypothetical protein n=1 Tax=Pasteuria penetrans TaxID=86005 RepID=UPI000F93BCDA|nr:hypothetical protein [Pasteuria penetrans]
MNKNINNKSFRRSSRCIGILFLNIIGIAFMNPTSFSEEQRELGKQDLATKGSPTVGNGDGVENGKVAHSEGAQPTRGSGVVEETSSKTLPTVGSGVSFATHQGGNQGGNSSEVFRDTMWKQGERNQDKVDEDSSGSSGDAKKQIPPSALEIPQQPSSAPIYGEYGSPKLTSSQNKKERVTTGDKSSRRRTEDSIQGGYYLASDHQTASTFASQSIGSGGDGDTNDPPTKGQFVRSKQQVKNEDLAENHSSIMTHTEEDAKKQTSTPPLLETREHPSIISQTESRKRSGFMHPPVNGSEDRETGKRVRSSSEQWNSTDPIESRTGYDDDRNTPMVVPNDRDKIAKLLTKVTEELYISHLFSGDKLSEKRNTQRRKLEEYFLTLSNIHDRIRVGNELGDIEKARLNYLEATIDSADFSEKDKLTPGYTDLFRKYTREQKTMSRREYEKFQKEYKERLLHIIADNVRKEHGTGLFPFVPTIGDIVKSLIEFVEKVSPWINPLSHTEIPTIRGIKENALKIEQGVIEGVKKVPSEIINSLKTLEREAENFVENPREEFVRVGAKATLAVIRPSLAQFHRSYSEVKNLTNEAERIFHVQVLAKNLLQGVDFVLKHGPTQMLVKNLLTQSGFDEKTATMIVEKPLDVAKEWLGKGLQWHRERKEETISYVKNLMTRFVQLTGEEPQKEKQLIKNTEEFADVLIDAVEQVALALTTDGIGNIAKIAGNGSTGAVRIAADTEKAEKIIPTGQEFQAIAEGGAPGAERFSGKSVGDVSEEGGTVKGTKGEVGEGNVLELAGEGCLAPSSQGKRRRSYPTFRCKIQERVVCGP